MSASSLRVVDESTLFTTVPYESVFAFAKQAASGLGGKIKSEDLSAGTIQAKFRYGINPTGIRVDVQLRRAAEGGTELVVKGRIGDSFDTTGAGRARGRDVFTAIVRQIEAGDGVPLTGEGPGAALFHAPIIGTTGFAHRGKSKTVAMLLAFFLGALGVHRFYLGSWGWGLVYLGLSLVGLGIGFPLGIVPSVYDGVLFLVMKQQNFDAKFNYSGVGPFTF